MESHLWRFSSGDVVFIVHGRGSGKLKEAIIDFLRGEKRVSIGAHIVHKLVSSMHSRWNRVSVIHVTSFSKAGSIDSNSCHVRICM